MWAGHKCVQVGMAEWGSSQINGWAGASAKIQVIFKKRKAFYNSPSAQIEIRLKTKLEVNLEAGVSVAVWQADHNERGEMSTAHPQQPPAPFSEHSL